jgi:F0F1-type ATP synthase membrane subunit b/b'
MKSRIILFSACLLLLSTVSTAQDDHGRTHERQSKIERKLNKAKKKDRIDASENQSISQYQQEVRERENKAHRNGKVTGGEDRKITRAQRKLKREVRDAAKD